MTPEKFNRTPRKLTLENLDPNLRNRPIVLACSALIFTIGCLFLGIGLNHIDLVTLNIYNWLSEVFLLLIVIVYFLWGGRLILNHQLIVVETYRLCLMTIIALVFLDVGVRNASLGESASMTTFYFFSILVSISLMLNLPKQTMRKMEGARAKGWLKNQLNEKEWTWNPGVYVDLDGPIAERERAGKLKILERLHYIMPGIASIVSFVFGGTESFHVVGFVFIYLGIIFVGEVGRMSGKLQQLRIWEIQEGRNLSFLDKKIDQ